MTSMSNMAAKRARCRFFKQEARRMLGEGSNLFALILALLALLMFTFALYMAIDGFFAFFDFDVYSPEPPAAAAVEAVRSGLYIFASVLLVLPLWYGLCAMAGNCIAGRRVVAADVFCAFDSPYTLLRVWRSALWLLWRGALSAGAIYALWYGVDYCYMLLPAAGYAAVCCGAVIVTPILLFPLAGTTLIFPIMLVRPELGVWRAARMASRLARRTFDETVIFFGSFAGWLTVGFASAGVLLVFYVLPYLLLAHAQHVLWILTQEREELLPPPYSISDMMNDE